MYQLTKSSFVHRCELVHSDILKVSLDNIQCPAVASSSNSSTSCSFQGRHLEINGAESKNYYFVTETVGLFRVPLSQTLNSTVNRLWCGWSVIHVQKERICCGTEFGRDSAINNSCRTGSFSRYGAGELFIIRLTVGRSAFIIRWNFWQHYLIHCLCNASV